jgi:hypothetical protein
VEAPGNLELVRARVVAEYGRSFGEAVVAARAWTGARGDAMGAWSE